MNDIELLKRIGDRLFQERENNLQDGFFFTYENDDDTFYVEFPDGSMILASGFDKNNDFIKIKDLNPNYALEKILSSKY